MSSMATSVSPISDSISSTRRRTLGGRSVGLDMVGDGTPPVRTAPGFAVLVPYADQTGQDRKVDQALGRASRSRQASPAASVQGSAGPSVAVWAVAWVGVSGVRSVRSSVAASAPASEPPSRASEPRVGRGRRSRRAGRTWRRGRGAQPSWASHPASSCRPGGAPPGAKPSDRRATRWRASRGGHRPKCLPPSRSPRDDHFSVVAPDSVAEGSADTPPTAPLGAATADGEAGTRGVAGCDRHRPDSDDGKHDRDHEPEAEADGGLAIDRVVAIRTAERVSSRDQRSGLGR